MMMMMMMTMRRRIVAGATGPQFLLSSPTPRRPHLLAPPIAGLLLAPPGPTNHAARRLHRAPSARLVPSSASPLDPNIFESFFGHFLGKYSLNIAAHMTIDVHNICSYPSCSLSTSFYHRGVLLVARHVLVLVRAVLYCHVALRVRQYSWLKIVHVKLTSWALIGWKNAPASVTQYEEFHSIHVTHRYGTVL